MGDTDTRPRAADDETPDPIYLDYNASTPIAPEVAAAMQRFLREAYGNPSNPHWAGTPARAAVDAARADVARLLGCETDEIVFTSGGSESNNLALKGICDAYRHGDAHIITTRIEHPSVVEPCRFLERRGVRVTWLEVDGNGLLDPDELSRAIESHTVLVSVMHANNEVGTIQPIAACAEIARAHGVLFHTDAAQSVGKIATRVDALGVDLLSLAGHKLYAPKGIGALYVRRGVHLEPLIHGADHELGRRAGTESALLATALASACTLAAELAERSAAVEGLRDRFWSRLREAFGERIVLNGHPQRRLPNTLNVSLLGHSGADILAALPEIAASTGSACHAGRATMSPVLSAMGASTARGTGAIRFSLGRDTTVAQIERAVRALKEAVA